MATISSLSHMSRRVDSGKGSLVCAWTSRGQRYRCQHKVTRASSSSNIPHSRTRAHLAGRYLKFSRALSQSPWVIDGESKTESSVQETIEAPLLPFFRPAGAFGARSAIP